MVTLPEQWGDTPVANENDPASWGDTPAADAPASPFSEEFVSKVKGWEGFAPRAKWDYKQSSVGYGTRARSADETISEEEADRRLREELTMHAQNVDKAAAEFGYQLTPRQREALISFDFNTGNARSVMQVSGGDLNDLTARMGRYVYAGGQQLEGLRNRRRSELEWFGGEPAAEDGPLAWGDTPVDDDAPENHDVRNAFVTGALDQGFYSGVEGMSRGLSNTLKQLGPVWGEAGVRAASALTAPGLAMQVGEMLTGGPQSSYRDTAIGVLDAYAEGTADVRRDVREAFPVTPEFQASLGGQIVSGFGQAVGTLPTYVIPGFGPASSVGMIYDQGYQDALQAGVSPAEAHEAALMNLPSAALDIVGDKLVIGRILKPLKGKMTVGQLAQSIGLSAASGGVTEAGQQFWQNLVAKHLAGYDPNRPLDQGVIDSLIVGAIVDSGVTGAGGGVTMLTGRRAPEDAATAPATESEPTLGDLQVAEELPADVEGLFVEDGSDANDGTDVTAPVSEEAVPQFSPAADRARVVDENLEAMRRLREIRQSGTNAADRANTVPTAPVTNEWGDEAVAETEPMSAEARAAELAYRDELDAELRDVEAEQTVGLDEALRRAGGLPGRRSPHWQEWSGELGQLWEARQGVRQNQGNARAFQNLFRDDAESLDTVTEALREQGFQVNTADDVFALVDDWLRTGREPRVMRSFEAQVAPDNIPFSKQLGIATTLPPEQAAPLADALRRAFDAAGVQKVPPVRLVQTVDEIPDHLGGRDARNAVAQGSIVEAFFDPRPKQRGITIVMDGAAQIAEQRGLTLEQRVQQLGLHEIVHHYQTMGALLPAQARREYNEIVEGVLGHISERERTELADLYGFDLSTPRGRAALAEEYLARFNEGQSAPPTWVRQVWARVLALLRRVFPGMRWTDADLRGLLDAARRRAEGATQSNGTAPSFARQELDEAGLPPEPRVLPDDHPLLIPPSRERATMPDGTPRAVWREAQIQQELAKGVPVPPGQKPIAYFLAGGPGAGKSELMALMQRQGKLPSSGVIEINPDNFTERNPDFIAVARTGDSRGARVVEGESSEMAIELYRRALQTRAPLIYDATLANPRVAEIVARQAREAGYETRLLGLTTDPMEALRGARGRAGRTGRYVTSDYGLHAHQSFNREVESYASLFDSWTLFGRTQTGVHTLAMAIGGDIVLDPTAQEEYVRFRERGESTARTSAPSAGESGTIAEQRDLRSDRGAQGAAGERPGVRPEARDPDPGESRGEVSFSQQQVEAVANEPQQRRRFIQSVKDAPFVKSDIRDRIESLYTPITNAETVAEAARQINTLGIDRALAHVLATNASNPPTALTNAMGIELLGRLQALQRYGDAGQLVEHMATQATTQGQAIQALSLLARLSPEGVQTYAQRQVLKVVQDNPEMQKLLEEIRKLREELAKAKKAQGTKAVLDVQDALKALKLDTRKLAEINTRIREILMTSIGQSGYARDRIVGVLVAAGMDRQKAIKLAERALKAFEREAKLARDKVLRQLLKQQVRDAIHGPAISAADKMNERLEKLFYANPGSVWGRYKQQAVNALAAKLTEGAARREMPALQEFTSRLIRQLQGMIPPEALANRPDLGPNPTPEAAYIGEAIRNFDKYQEVWTAAQDFIRDKYRNDDFTLTQLDGYLGQILARPFSPTSLTKAVDQTLRSLNVRIGDLLLRSKWQQGKTAELVAKIITEQARVDGVQARELAEAVMQEIGRQSQTARESFAKRLLTPKEKRSGATKSELQRWIELNNAGLLDDDALLEQIAERRGLPMLTREKVREIQRLQAEYAATPDGVVKLTKAAEMLDHIHSMIPAGGWSKVRAAQNISMLLNPKTAGRNILGNAAMWVGNTVADGVSAPVDRLVSVVTGKRTAPSFYLAARLRGLRAPVEDYRAGRDHVRSQGADRMQSIVEGVKTMVAMARLTSAGKYDVNAIGQAHRHVFSSRVGRLFEDTLSASLGVFDRAFHQSAYLAALEREMNTRGEVAPSEESVTAAHLAASKAVYQDENFVSKYLGQATKAVNRLSTLGATDRYGLGTIIMPFTQVPGALLLRGAEWSPIGFIRTGYEVFRPAFGREFRQAEFVDAFTRAALGSGTMALGFFLFKLGVLSGAPEEDKDREAMRRASGFGSYRINVSELKRRFLSGNWHSPASQLEAAQEGDVIVNYDWLQPSAVPIAMGAQMAEYEDQARREMQKGKAAELPSVALTMISAGAKTLEDQPLLTGLFKFAGDMSRAHQQGDSILEPVGRTLIGTPGNFIPGTLAAQVGQLLDNTPRETRGGNVFAQELNRMVARIPGASGQFPARYDIFGEMQERYQYGRNTLFNVLLNPAFVSEVRKNPVTAELERIYRATGDAGAVPRAVDRKITVNGQQLELTNEQISAYQRYTGRLTMSIFSQIIAAPGYARLPDTEKARILASILGDVNVAAKQELFGQPAVTVGRTGAFNVNRRAILFRALGRARGILNEE